MKLRRVLLRLTITVAFLLVLATIPANSQTTQSAAQQVEDLGRIDLTTLEQRAASGDATAEFWLGYRFYNGIGISQNFGQAAAWFRKAADQGRPEAQYYLGMINARGYGMAPNLHDARIWFQMAAVQGHQGAKDELTRLGSQEQQRQAQLQQREEREGLAKQSASEQQLEAASQVNTS